MPSTMTRGDEMAARSLDALERSCGRGGCGSTRPDAGNSWARCVAVVVVATTARGGGGAAGSVVFVVDW